MQEEKIKENTSSNKLQLLQNKFDSYYQFTIDSYNADLRPLVVALKEEQIEKSLQLFEDLFNQVKEDDPIVESLLGLSRELTTVLSKKSEVPVQKLASFCSQVFNHLLPKLSQAKHYIAFCSQAGDTFKNIGMLEHAIAYYSTGLRKVDSSKDSSLNYFIETAEELLITKITILEINYTLTIFKHWFYKEQNNFLKPAIAMIIRLIYIEHWNEAQSIYLEVKRKISKNKQVEAADHHSLVLLQRLHQDIKFNKISEDILEINSFKPIVIGLRPLLEELRLQLEKNLASGNDITSLQQEFSVQTNDFIIQPIVKRALECLPTLPCNLELLSLGSRGNLEVGPYSDLDCALLIDNEVYRFDIFFTWLIELMQNYLHCLAEPWLLTDRQPQSLGLHIDTGDLEYLIGTNKLLCHTPSGLVNWIVQEVQKISKKNSHAELAFSLLSTSSIYKSNPSNDLRGNYHAQLVKALLSISSKQVMTISPWQRIVLNYCKLQSHTYLIAQKIWTRNDIINLKDMYLKPIIFWCQYMGLYYGLTDTQGFLTRSHDILLKLQDTIYFKSEFITRLQLFYKKIQLLRVRYQLDRKACLDEVIIPIKADPLNLKGFPPNKLPRSFLPKLTKKQYRILQQNSANTLQPLYQDLGNFVDHFLGGAFRYDPLDTSMQTALIIWEQNKELEGNEAADQILKHFIANLVTGFSLAKVSVETYGNAYTLCPDHLQQWFKDCINQTENLPRSSEVLGWIAQYPGPDGNCPALIQAELTWKNQLQTLVWLDNGQNREKYKQTLPNYPIIKVAGALLPEQESNYILQPDVVKTLIDPKTGDFIEYKRTLLPGRRNVIPIILSDENSYHFKAWPELPGMSLAADILLGCLTGQQGWSDIWRFEVEDLNKIYPVLISQTVPVESFQDQLDKNADESFNFISDEDFTRWFLAVLLMNFGNAKPDSFYHNSKLIMIDTEHVFLESVTDNTTNISFMGKFQQKSPLNIFCFLYCLDQMNIKLEVQAVKRFLRLNPYQVLNFWLNKIVAINTRLNEMFSKEEQASFFNRSKPDWSQISIKFHPTFIALLFQKMTELQSYLLNEEITLYNNSINPIVHMTLLKHFEPGLHHYYELAIQDKKTPSERFDSLFKSVTPSAESRSFWQKTLSTYISPEKFLKELVFIHTGFQKIIQAGQDLMDKRKANTSSFLELPSSYCVEQVINAIDFQGVSEGNERIILNALQKQAETFPSGFHQLRLRYCKTFTDQQLARTLSKTTYLSELDLTGCKQITYDQLSNSVNSMKFLRKLNLSKINELTRLGSRLSNFSLPVLSELIMNDCLAIQKIRLKAPFLKRVDLSHCKSLESVHISADSINIVNFQRCVMLDDIYLSASNIKFISFRECSLSLSLLSTALSNVKEKVENIDLHRCEKIPGRWMLESCPSLASKFNSTWFILFGVSNILDSASGIDPNLDIDQILMLLTFFSTYHVDRDAIVMAGIIFYKLSYYKAAKICFDNAEKISKSWSFIDLDSWQQAVAKHLTEKNEGEDLSLLTEMFHAVMYKLRRSAGDDSTDVIDLGSEDSAAYGFIRINEFYRGLQMLIKTSGLNNRDSSSEGLTPLIRAIDGNDLATIRYLLSHGANPNVPGSSRLSPIAYATQLPFQERKKVIDLLLSYGAQINAHNNSVTPLMLATSNHSEEELRWLIQKQADIRAGIGNNDALFIAVMIDNEKIVDLFLSYLDKITIINTDYCHLLLNYAAKNGNFYLIGKLLSYGHKINYLDRTKQSLLHFVARQNKINNINILHYFLSHPTLKDMINYQNSYGNTPLLIAAKLGKLQHLQLLANYGADKTAKNFNNENGLFLSLLSGKQQNVEFFAQQDNQMSDIQMQILHLINSYEKKQTITNYLSNSIMQVGINSEIINLTFLYAVQNHFEKTIKALLDHSAIIVNYEDSLGATALYYAVEYRHEIDFIRNLLHRGYHPRCFESSKLYSLSDLIFDGEIIDLIEEKKLAYCKETQSLAYAVIIESLFMCYQKSCLELADSIIALAFPELEAKHFIPNSKFINSYFFVRRSAGATSQGFIRSHISEKWQSILRFLSSDCFLYAKFTQDKKDSNHHNVDIKLICQQPQTSSTLRRVMMIIQNNLLDFQASNNVGISLTGDKLSLSIYSNLYYRCLDKLFEELSYMSSYIFTNIHSKSIENTLFSIQK